MHCHTISVRIKNGRPDLSDDPEFQIPSVLLQCEQLWKDRGRSMSWPREQWAFVRGAIEPLLYARIEPEPEHYTGGLLNPKRPILTEAIELLSISFEGGSIPTITAHAQFQMAFDRSFADTSDFYHWQEQTDWMDWGLCFGFRSADGSEWDATYEHSGIDFEIVTD